MYLPSRQRVCVVPIAAFKAGDDAQQAAARWNAELDAERAGGGLPGELTEEPDLFEALERPPVDYQTRVHQQRIAQRGFARRADVMTLLERLDLPLQSSMFMIAPWPPR